MARLNTRISATPLPSRATTVDSLYRAPTPVIHNGVGTTRTTSYSVMSPSQSTNSDKENDGPESRETTPQLKSGGKAKAMAPGPGQRPPTPDSGSITAGNPNKRRRVSRQNAPASEIYVDEDAMTDDAARDNQAEQEPTPAMEDEEEEGGSRFYNPLQDPEKRRRLRAGLTNNYRDLQENRDEYVKPGNTGLLTKIRDGDVLMGKVRQTAEATLDSAFIVMASDLAGKQLSNNLQGNNDIGVDVDQFVSRCIYYMTEGHAADSTDSGPTQRRARRAQQSRYTQDEEEMDGDGLDWAFLGRSACFPSNKRPPVCNFLLGPLSVERRVRTVQMRKARSQRQPLGPATRPQEIRQEDMQKNENSTLTTLVKGIRARLQDHIEVGSKKIEQELEAYDVDPEEDLDSETVYAACCRQRVYQTPDEEPAVSLFDFAINPVSFGQTVENLFYISFLIREGAVQVVMDNDGLPLLVPAQPRTIAEQRSQDIEKQQAIFSIDWPTWKMLIEAFDIKDPLIPHREPEETVLAAGAWYT